MVPLSIVVGFRCSGSIRLVGSLARWLVGWRYGSLWLGGLGGSAVSAVWALQRVRRLVGWLVGWHWLVGLALRQHFGGLDGSGAACAVGDSAVCLFLIRLCLRCGGPAGRRLGNMVDWMP